MPIPNFLIIGAARSGSTYLARNLATHPEVYVPVEKELNFFDQDYERGLSYYRQYFDGATPEEHTAIGEATPTYMCSEEVAERIHDTIPDAKLITILRNPVDRAYSHYWNVVATYDGMMDRSYAEKLDAHPFEDELENQPQLVEQGLYAQHLRPFIDRFGRDQLLVLLYEEVTQHPDRYFADTFRFLGVDETFRSPLVERRINSSGQRHGRSSVLLRLYNFFTAYVNVPLLARWIENANEQSYPSMKAETRAALEERFQEPNRELEELLGRSLDVWASPDNNS